MSGNGAYSMSKHALSAFSDTLRQEMRKWGVHVAVVEPTGFSTGNIIEYFLCLSLILIIINPGATKYIEVENSNNYYFYLQWSLAYPDTSFPSSPFV